MRFLVAIVLLAGCFFDDSDGELCDGQPCPVTGPASVTPPANDVFVAVREDAMTTDVSEETTLAIDMHDCVYRRYQKWLGLGSAWFLVHPQDASYCEMWLGGETENPNYDGHPAQYCVFDRERTLYINTQAGGGPITLANQPSCVTVPR